MRACLRAACGLSSRISQFISRPIKNSFLLTRLIVRRLSFDFAPVFISLTTSKMTKSSVSTLSLKAITSPGDSFFIIFALKTRLLKNTSPSAPMFSTVQPLPSSLNLSCSWLIFLSFPTMSQVRFRPKIHSLRSSLPKKLYPLLSIIFKYNIDIIIA